MSERKQDEKAEKEEEKRGEKEEKSWEEKWRRDPLSAIGWAIVLIWAGLVLLVDNLGLMAQFGFWEAWAVFFAGAGLIVLLGVVIRLLVPEYRRPVVGSLIIGLILLSIGLGDLISWGIVWAVVLIAIGVIGLLRGLGPRR